jgi:hypothetical protein
MGFGTNGVEIKTRVPLRMGSNGVGTQASEGMDRAGGNGVGGIVGKGIDRLGEEIATRKIKVITNDDDKHP